MIASISSRAVHVATTTSRSLSSRAGSQSSSLSARSQGNLSQKRGLQDTNLRSLSSSSSTQWTDAEDKSIWGLTASAFATGGAVALYLASDFQKVSTTTQCSSFAPMEQQAGTSIREYTPTSKALIQRTVANTGLRRILTEPNGESKESTLKSTSTSISFLPKKKLDVTSLTPPSERDVNVLKNMEQVPAASMNMIDVVEASVKQASTWEKKAKAAVSMLTNPSRYEVSFVLSFSMLTTEISSSSYIIDFSEVGVLIRTKIMSHLILIGRLHTDTIVLFLKILLLDICEGYERWKALYGRFLLHP